MTKVSFTDTTTINVVALDGEIFILKAYLPVTKDEQYTIAKFLSHYFDEYFSVDKTSMIYWVLMKMMANLGFSFYYGASDRSQDRERIGAKIRHYVKKRG